jgi:hypothetical protein
VGEECAAITPRPVCHVERGMDASNIVKAKDLSATSRSETYMKVIVQKEVLFCKVGQVSSAPLRCLRRKK